MRLLFVALLWAPSILFAQDQGYIYTSHVDSLIPQDSIGVRDTIFIPDHVTINDINFYVGIGRPGQPWAEHVLIDVFSPSRVRVRLNDWGGYRILLYDVWYDTEREEDGPGQLEDYARGDAYGPWEMFCFDPFEGNLLTWYYWRIEVIGTMSGVEGALPAVPTQFAITEIAPNPFNARTAIDYEVPSDSPVRLEVFDLGGRRVRTLFEGRASAGYHRIIWDGTAGDGETVASGVYLIRLTSGDIRVAKRATLLK